MNREQIQLALFAQLQPLVGFTTVSRRLRHWHDTPAEMQPSLMVSHVSEDAQTNSGQPTKWRIRVELYIYVRLGADDAPGPKLNPLIDAVCNAVNSTTLSPTCVNNLGLPNVAYCRVEGDVQIDEGTLDNQAVAIIPVVILAT